MPKSSKSDIRVESAVDGTSRVVIAQISYARLVACVLVQLLRLVIGAVLLWFGSLYLIHTNDDGINTCCGSANQTEAIEIWSQCLAGE